MSAPPAFAAARARSAVVLHLDPDALEAAETALSAALSLFEPTDPVDVVIALDGIEEPTHEHVALLTEWFPRLVPAGKALPELTLVGTAEAAAIDTLLRLELGPDPVANARAAVLLTAFAETLDDADPHATQPRTLRAPDAATDAARILPARANRAFTQARIALRDAERAGRPGRVPHIVVLFQHRSYWGAVETVCAALQARDDIDFDLVAIDSPIDQIPGGTAELVAEHGYETRDGEWLREHLGDIDIVMLDNPYDNFRPEGLRTTDLANAGIRLAYVPYGNNVGAGELILQWQYDLPLHQCAWRVFARSLRQVDMYGRHCAVGNYHVHAAGLPKLDRSLQSAPSEVHPLREQAGDRPVFLWNPHFTVGVDARQRWSTFDLYCEALLEYFAAHPEAVLLVRPHFRLFQTLQQMGGRFAGLETRLKDAVVAHENIWLDDAADYVTSFQVADAMLSDASSLITEFMPTGKPILYLVRADGPGINEDAGYFDDLYQARAWDDVETFLSMVVDREDPMRDMRLASVAENFHLLDGHAGERIAEHLVTSFRSETGPPRRSAASALPGTSQEPRVSA